MKTTVRKNGKYYQIGYYQDSKWINLEQCGTADKLLDLVRLGKEIRSDNKPLLEAYQKILSKKKEKDTETYQTQNDPEIVDL